MFWMFVSLQRNCRDRRAWRSNGSRTRRDVEAGVHRESGGYGRDSGVFGSVYPCDQPPHEQQGAAGQGSPTEGCALILVSQQLESNSGIWLTSGVENSVCCRDNGKCKETVKPFEEAFLSLHSIVPYDTRKIKRKGRII